MQRKPTKNTRGPSAEEKRFAAYTKESDCIACGAEGPSIVDHVAGATYKHNKVLIGHWFLIPLCVRCDTIKTQGSGKALVKSTGFILSDLWRKHLREYPSMPAIDIYNSIMDCGK